MFARIVTELGPWSWMAAGFALLILEIIVPGVFFLWVGLAAILTGALAIILQNPFGIMLGWQAEWLLFAVLAFGAVLAGRAVNRREPSAENLLPDRLTSLIGRRATLESPIINGKGSVRLGDTLWRIAGPDLAAGTPVRVTGAANGELTVSAD
jgi:inner membrane protein